ncbi:L,D-transpeptidase family protein [Brevibacterium casei]
MFSRRTRLCAGIVGLAFALASCAPTDEAPDRHIAAPAQQPRVGDFAVPAQLDPGKPGAASADGNGTAATAIPGLGPETSAQIPAETSQVIVVSSEKASADSGELSFYEREDGVWEKRKTFPTHNGSNGWLADRREGDKTTPIGVFTLTDAGGYKKNPGTKLGYTQDDGLPASATAAYGEAYTRVFDYIVAIDYNRRLGTPPTDRTRPEGKEKGGGIWLHLDHESGTNGCVTLKEKDLLWIMRTLDPKAQPRIAMGPVAELKR